MRFWHDHQKFSVDDKASIRPAFEWRRLQLFAVGERGKIIAAIGECAAGCFRRAPH